jgi:YrbI family 3-deoxy-D-manno-octulosonate 8-phosphate phosphatase
MKKAPRKKPRLKDKLAGLRMVVFDFDGVFTDNRVLVLQDGREGVLCSRADGLGLEKLLVLSTEPNPVVGARCRKLKLLCIQGCRTKAATLVKIAAEKRIPLSDVLYMGNDINDLECLDIVGLPVCVADAHPQVRARSSYQTRALGGYGAVREICDKIVEVRAARTRKRTA